MVYRKRSLEEYDDDYKPLSKRMHSMYLKDGPLNGENILADSNAYGVSIYNLQSKLRQCQSKFWFFLILNYLHIIVILIIIHSICELCKRVYNNNLKKLIDIQGF